MSRVSDHSDISGIGIYTTDEADTLALLEEDPAVRAGGFRYRLHATRTEHLASRAATS